MNLISIAHVLLLSMKLRFTARAFAISPEVQVHVEHYEELQLAGQSRVVEWSNVEQVYR
jgi:hypothetical protein